MLNYQRVVCADLQRITEVISCASAVLDYFLVPSAKKYTKKYISQMRTITLVLVYLPT